MTIWSHNAKYINKSMHYIYLKMLHSQNNKISHVSYEKKPLLLLLLLLLKNNHFLK